MPNQYDTREGLARFEVRDLRGMSPVQMRQARVEFRARARELHEDSSGQVRDKTDAESREFKHCLELVDAIDAHLAWDQEVRGTIARHPRSVVGAREVETRDGQATFRGAGYGEVPPRVAEDRDRAFAVIDEYRASDVLSARAADRLDEVLRGRDPAGATARYLTAVGDPAYRTPIVSTLATSRTGFSAPVPVIRHSPGPGLGSGPGITAFPRRPGPLVCWQPATTRPVLTCPYLSYPAPA